jgi:hypothetical protein
MAKHPGNYRTRYTKLTGKQRTVFKAVGPAMGVEFRERLATGDAFYGYCEGVRTKLKDWCASLPEAALKISELSEPQRLLLRSLRGPVPPQLPVLADSLVAMMQEDAGTHDELTETTADGSSPEIQRVWREFREKIARYVEGVKAPVREAIRTALGTGPDGSERTSPTDLSVLIRSASTIVGQPGNPLSQVADRLADQGSEDAAVLLAVAVTGKTAAALTDEDFGRAKGIMDIAGPLAKQQAELAKQQKEQKARGDYVVSLPNGQRRTIAAVAESVRESAIVADLVAWQSRFSLTANDAVFFALRELFASDSDSEVAQGESLPLDQQPVATSEMTESSEL